jgi:hypothetical protein
MDVRLRYANLVTIEGGMVARNVGFADGSRPLKPPGCASRRGKCIAFAGRYEVAYPHFWVWYPHFSVPSRTGRGGWELVEIAPRPARQEVARGPPRAASTFRGGELPPGCGSTRLLPWTRSTSQLMQRRQESPEGDEHEPFR